MPHNAFKPVRRVRTEFDSTVALTPRRRRSDRDPSRQFGLYEPESRNGSEARLILYFAAVLVCTALGVGLEEMRMAGAAWSLFIVGAAFLSAAVRALFVAPRRVTKH
jgi:hypothetical protein